MYIWHGKPEIHTFVKSIAKMAETVQHKMLTKGEILALLAQNRRSSGKWVLSGLGFSALSHATPHPQTAMWTCWWN
ncbi:MAG: hypothetical protein IPN74_15765 [Haliscomenobacter sp.]|nr:hypothetical protein [Haliscomenobacter sp.]